MGSKELQASAKTQQNVPDFGNVPYWRAQDEAGISLCMLARGPDRPKCTVLWPLGHHLDPLPRGFRYLLVMELGLQGQIMDFRT